MNTAQRMLPYARQYVIIAIYEILEHDGVPYKKTDSSTVVFHGNKGIFSISVSEQVKGTQLFVTMEQANADLSQAGDSVRLTLSPDKSQIILKMKQSWRSIRQKEFLRAL